MANKKKKKSKSKKRSHKPREKDSELNRLKKTLSDLYVRVNENLNVILIQTRMGKEDLANFIKNNGYIGLKKLPNLKVAEPILDEMIKTFTLYDSVSNLVERMVQAENKVFINQIEKKTAELESKVAEIEKEDKFYTKREDGGFYSMKQKWFLEKAHWEKQKAEAELILNEFPDDQDALAQLTQAERELGILGKKKNWARMQNIQPNITKYAQKVGKVVNMVQDSVQEITKPFAQIGDASGYNNTPTTKQKKQPVQKNQYEDFFGKIEY